MGLLSTNAARAFTNDILICMVRIFARVYYICPRLRSFASVLYFFFSVYGFRSRRCARSIVEYSVCMCVSVCVFACARRWARTRTTVNCSDKSTRWSVPNRRRPDRKPSEQQRTLKVDTHSDAYEAIRMHLPFSNFERCEQQSYFTHGPGADYVRVPKCIFCATERSRVSTRSVPLH